MAQHKKCKAYHNCHNHADKTDKIQCHGFNGQSHYGIPIRYDYYGWKEDTWKAFKEGTYGMTLRGHPCYGSCTKSGQYSYWCYTDSKLNWDYCYYYNRDQYGRKCVSIDKRISQVTCEVENAHKYWAHNGGWWGYTHPPIAPMTHDKTKESICRVHGLLW
ncbi:maco-A 94/2 36 [Carp edema virus]|nr:maco-A 94/2 36 [Carp edema virus]